MAVFIHARIDDLERVLPPISNVEPSAANWRRESCDCAAGTGIILDHDAVPQTSVKPSQECAPAMWSRDRLKPTKIFTGSFGITGLRLIARLLRRSSTAVRDTGSQGEFSFL